MSDLNSLMIFAQVVEANSFSEAARRLQMPTSTVSRRIADLEEELGVRLIERSTRSLRLTDIGSEVLEQARRSVEISEAIDNIASNHLSKVSGTLRLSAPPSISDSLLAPLVGAFQTSYPDVRVQIFITERIVDQIAEGVDLAFRVGELEDSSLVARRILTYRHQLVASPAYLEKRKPPEAPQDLLGHRLLAFSFWRPEKIWSFTHANRKDKETLTFQPYLSINEYAGLATALLAGTGIGDLPPIVQPELLRSGRLVEVMPHWHFPLFHLSVVHLGNRYTPRPVRVFKEFAAKMAPALFPTLPT
ncbi:MAG: LysR family transcriptional regulator [Acidobacteriaceae bacterium]|nr:LysR family transcriptional regulator [Acidobacteriaceae bacterium]